MVAASVVVSVVVIVGDGDIEGIIMLATTEEEEAGTIVVLQIGSVNPGGHVQVSGAVQLPPLRHALVQTGVQGELPPV